MGYINPMRKSCGKSNPMRRILNRLEVLRALSRTGAFIQHPKLTCNGEARYRGGFAGPFISSKSGRVMSH